MSILREVFEPPFYNAFNALTAWMPFQQRRKAEYDLWSKSRVWRLGSTDTLDLMIHYLESDEGVTRLMEWIDHEDPPIVMDEIVEAIRKDTDIVFSELFD